MKSLNWRRYDWVIASLALAGSLQLVFAITYPLNSGASDNPVYLEMIRSGASNLILAGGYPFVLHAALGLLQVPPPHESFDSNWLWTIQVTQNLIHFSFLVAFAWLAGSVFGKANAGWLIVLLGCSTLFLGGLDSAAPEWLQGDLIALSLLVSARAFVGGRHKVVLYAASSALVTLAFLVKPNSLVVAPFLVVLVLLDEGALTRRLLALAVSGLLAGGLLLFFVTSVQLPTTGTRDLNYDHAWVLTASLPNDYFESPADELGINALRWRALSAILPPDYSRAEAFPTVDTGAPAAEKAAYLPRYRDVMQMSRAALVDFVDKHPLPTDFKQGVSAIPLYWYIGLKPADDLGIAVFEESLASRWPDYLRRVVAGLGTWGALQVNIVPFESQPLGLLLNGAPNGSGFEHYTVPQGSVPQFVRYWNPAQTIWAPGMNAMGLLSELVLPRFAEICLVLLSLTAILRLSDHRRRTVAILIFAAIATVAVSGCLLFGVRDKELIALLPTLAIFYSFGLSWLSTLLKGGIEALWHRLEARAA